MESNEIEKCYFDCKGIEVREGDLVKVFHFLTGTEKRKIKHYMYHVVVIENNLFGARHYSCGSKRHYWLKSFKSGEKRIISDIEIVYQTGEDVVHFPSDRKKIKVTK